MHKYNFAVPVTSCRGGPSMAAGTLLQEFSTLHASYALTCSYNAEQRKENLWQP